MADPGRVALEPEPIPGDWILNGEPRASVNRLIRTRDWNSTIVVWECTAGRFKWQYDKDETLVVISGHATLTDESGEERPFGPGDMVFFPAGSSCTWHITDRMRKVAVVRESIWLPLGMALKICRKLLRMAGIAGRSPLMLAIALFASWSVQ